MECYLCRKKAEIKQQKNRSICNGCFLELIEKRIRKNTRVNKLFSKGDKIKVNDELSRYFVESISNDIPIKVVEKNGNKKTVKWTLDDEINKFLKDLMMNNKEEDINGIKLLKVITDQEANKFSELKGIKFKANNKDAVVMKIVDDLSEKHPDMRFNLFKNVELLNRLTNKDK
ncbi:hypothetical protein GF336_02550 [Candidatus Woesearchaeota archaeon]|nr:hypothetical protein [Candidatus Woesearchaeota archaeon]